ncbi:MAG: hypothetical protein O3C27_05400 [Actinomycetota bacterium]|nr:hypothetical protein [Actinomycetota bacterium]
MNSAVDVVADDVDAAPILQGMTAVTAPVSGVIWTTDVEIGKAVAATDAVAIDGAMKMETAVNSIQKRSDTSSDVGRHKSW